jgi:hypothetical protein
MKPFIIGLLLICGVACTTQAKMPSACQRNLDDCNATYQTYQKRFCQMRDNSNCNADDWSQLCNADLNVCLSNYGM